MDVYSPVALRRESGRRDTFFPVGAVDVTAEAAPPNLADPTLRLVGHYEGTPTTSRFRATYGAPPRGYRSADGADDPLAPLARAGLLPLARRLLAVDADGGRGDGAP